MSWRPTLEPATTTCAEPRLSAIIDARKRDIGSLSVRRLLPSPRLATLGPFVYMDHMGPHAVATAGPIDVPQHPHINLSTLTYLFDGELTHRDSTRTKSTNPCISAQVRYIPFVRMARFVRMADREFLGATKISGGWKTQFPVKAKRALEKQDKKPVVLGDSLFWYRERDGRIVVERAK